MRRIYQPVLEDLGRVEERLRGFAATSPAQLSGFLDYVLHNSGKRLRPAITLLTARLGQRGHDLAILMASAVELLHLASLIHDDTVDNSAVRRGHATVNDRWGHTIAVLLGDYIFAASGTLVCDTRNVRVIRRFSETIMELSSGELQEYCQTFRWQLSRKDYEERIFRKTASLFQTAAESGALLGGAPEEWVQALKSYGYNIGMAFQIVDDILDYEGDAKEVGKPVGNDLLQGVVTLPAIILTERYPEDNLIRRLFSDDTGRDRLPHVLEMIHTTGLLEECYAVAKGFCDQAARALDIVPDSPARRSLLELTRYVMERRH